MTNQYLASIIDKAKQGMPIEGTNLDIKRSWWNLDSELDEFLKDICSMANSTGGESYIIIGLDKNGNIYNSSLPDDEANIQAKHKEKIEPKLNITIEEVIFENKKISIITIPHSTNRPHIIKKYKNIANQIPVRFGSSTTYASRADIDVMYEERGMLDAPNVSIAVPKKEISWENYAEYRGYCFAIQLIIDNYDGRASDYITSVVLRENSGEHWTSKHFLFQNSGVLDHPLKIDAREVKDNFMVYVSDELPTGLRDYRQTPDFDRDKLQLIFNTRSGKEIIIEPKPSWIQQG